jgi:hypothetical protein
MTPLDCTSVEHSDKRGGEDLPLFKGMLMASFGCRAPSTRRGQVDFVALQDWLAQQGVYERYNLIVLLLV